MVNFDTVDFPYLGGGGVLAVYMTGVPTELYIANPKKYMGLKFYTQKNTWHQNLLPQKTIPSTLILIIQSDGL